MAVQHFKPDQKKAEEVATSPTGSRSGGSDFRWFYTHKLGDYKVRILPPWDEKGLIGMVVGKHYAIPGEEDENTEKHTCVEVTHPDMGANCPICDVLRKYKDAGMDVRKHEVRDKGYMNAILLEAPEEFWASDDNLQSGDVVIFNHPVTTHDWVWRQIYDSDVGDITDPKEGYDIKISRVKKKGNIRYDRKVVPKSRPIAESEEEIAEILGKMYNLSDIWSQPDDEIYEKIKAGAKRLDSMLGSRLQRAQEHVSSPGGEVDTLAGDSKATSSPSAPPPPPSGSKDSESEKDETPIWYLPPEGEVTEGVLQDVKDLLSDGVDPTEVMVMSHDQSSGWKTAEDWGV